jgi:Flp pilus assembly protein TadG
MRHLLASLARFSRDERGVFAVTFGLMALVLVAFAGATVDFTSVQQAKTRAQVALDAATLALQPEIFNDTMSADQIGALALELVDERLNDPRLTTTVEDVIINVADGSLYIEVRLVMPTIFVQFVNVREMEALVYAEATRRKLALEVAMVLDNSGSMAQQSRMSHLQEAAECATNILFFGDCDPPYDAEKQEDVKVGLIPFTTMVNIGSGNADAEWLDRGEYDTISSDNFDNDDNSANDFTGPVDRLALYDQINNVSWKGCVEAREYPYSVNDAVPDAGDPETLFTVAFAPDEPDTEATSGWSRIVYNNNYLSDDPSACYRAASCTCTKTVEDYWSGGRWRTRTVTNCSLTRTDGTVRTGSSVCSCPNHTTGTRTCSVNVSYVSHLNEGSIQRRLQERLCKYTGNANGVTNFQKGPNAGCLDAEILPLTENTDDIFDAIDDMRAEGGTNIHQGAIWGYHVLSPTEPFSEGEPYEEATSKVMILMTDGENTFYTGRGSTSEQLSQQLNNTSFNQAYGFSYNEREGDMNSTNTSVSRRMDVLLAETCENAKDDDIVIYTIGLATDDVTLNTPEAVRKLLRDCASGTANAYFPDDPDELVGVFEDIAGQLARLRLAQ